MTATLTGYLMAASEQPTEIYKIGLASVRFLLAVGDLLIGWRLLVQADVAARRAAGRTARSDEAFYQGKIATAAFFAAEHAAEPHGGTRHRREPRRRHHASVRGRVLVVSGAETELTQALCAKYLHIVSFGDTVQIRQWATADFTSFVGRQTEQPQDVFGHGVGSFGVVPVGLVAQQVAQSEKRSAGHGQREFGILDGESPRPIGLSDVAQGAWRQPLLGRQQRHAVGQQDLTLLRATAEHPPGQPEAAGEGFGGIFDRCVSWSSSAPWASSTSVIAASNSCSLLSKWL